MTAVGAGNPPDESANCREYSAHLIFLADFGRLIAAAYHPGILLYI